MTLAGVQSNAWQALFGLLTLLGLAIHLNVGNLRSRLPLFRSRNQGAVAIGWALLGVVVVIALVGAIGNRPSVARPTPSPAASAVAVTALPTSTSAGTTPVVTTPAPPTPAPTPVPTSAAVQTPVPTAAPIVLTGRGQTATEAITLRSDPSRATFTHDGRSNFAVYLFRGTQRTLLINEIGIYRGDRPLTGTAPFQLSVEADGPWTISIQPPDCCARSAEFAGRGDAMSNLFNVGGVSAWQFEHDGKSNFAVYLHCRGSRQLVQNEIGRFSGSKIVVFGAQPCWWEVEADGNWSIRPR